MANEETKVKKNLEKSPLIGSIAEPTVLDTSARIDIDTNKELMDTIIEAGLSNKLDTSEIENFTRMSNVREQIYQMIDTMMQDSSVSAIVRTYAEDVCETADNGHVIWAESADPKVSKFVNYLLDLINADKKLFGWAYSLIEYGDVYLRLYRESDNEDKFFKSDRINRVNSTRNILNEDMTFNQDFDEKDDELNESIQMNIRPISDHYSYFVDMVPDPSTMYELIKLGKTHGYIETPNTDVAMNFLETTNMTGQNTATVANYKMKSNDINIFQADDFVHAYLADNTSRFPETVNIISDDDPENTNTKNYSYTVRRGKSMLYDSYKVWREKTLLESAILLTRITRSSLIQKVQVEVGDMSKEKAHNTLRNIKQLFEQKTTVDPNSSMSEYTNPGAIVNYVYLTTHGGQGAVSVESIGGDINIKDLADLDNWTNKFYSAYGIPKQYFGYTDDAAGFNGGSSLSIISSVYSKGVKRVQNALIQAITDCINLFLIDKGYPSYINRFVLKMKAPVTQEEKDYRESLTNQVSAVSNFYSLFADVEDKPRKLRILKELTATLNYGDGITAELDGEIKDAEAQKKKAEEDELAKQAEEEAANNGGGGADMSFDTSGSSEPEESAEPSTDEFDLGMSSVTTEEQATESFTTNGGKVLLTEDLPDLESLTEDDDLPTPEELNKDIDFTKNV